MALEVLEAGAGGGRRHVPVDLVTFLAKFDKVPNSRARLALVDELEAIRGIGDAEHVGAILAFIRRLPEKARSEVKRAVSNIK